MKNFSIFKIKEKKNEKAPDYSISLKVGEHYVNVGACWIKDGKSGKYMSCKLSDAYGDSSGFVISQERLEEPKTDEVPNKDGFFN